MEDSAVSIRALIKSLEENLDSIEHVVIAVCYKDGTTTAGWTYSQEKKDLAYSMALLNARHQQVLLQNTRVVPGTTAPPAQIIKHDA